MPGVGTGPYDNCEFVMQMARAMANDAALSIAGNILSDTQPYVFLLLEKAYRELRKMMTSEGVTTFARTLIVTGLTPVANPRRGCRPNDSSPAFLHWILQRGQQCESPRTPA